MTARYLRPMLWIGLPLMLIVASVPAMAQSWSSFSTATFTGITLTPVFTNGVTSYQLCLSKGATVNGQAINWIQAFYAVGGTQATAFTATDSSNSLGWTFNSSTSSGQISGWTGLGSNRLVTPTTNTPVCGTFNYGAFTIPAGSTVVPGFHIGYGTGSDSGFFKGPVSAVPEPSTVLASLMTILFGTGGLLIRRKA